MSWSDRSLWSALISVPGIGPQTFRRIIECLRRYQVSAEDFWSGSASLITECLPERARGNWRRFQQRFSLAGYQEWLDHQSVQVVTELDETYPAKLQVLPDRPPVLFVKGAPLKHWLRPVAVVGTRKATPYGTLATEKLVTEMVSYGMTIISGFMYGIDLLAHQTARQVGGSTVGVLGCGFSYLYPAAQQQLFQEWVASGMTFVTELPPSAHATKSSFVRRNRIVAGLADGVLVVEAAEKSGSLITAAYALEYGREVMAVPGPVHSVYSQGTTWLVNQGATLVTSGKAVWETLKDQWPTTHDSIQLPETQLDSASSLSCSLSDAFQKTIYNQLRLVPQSENELQAALGEPMNKILTTLTIMEVAGWLKRRGSLWVVNV